MPTKIAMTHIGCPSQMGEQNSKIKKTLGIQNQQTTLTKDALGTAISRSEEKELSHDSM